MKAKLLVAAALTGALAAAGAAQAQDFQPKEKGTIILNVRITQVDPAGTDPLTTLAGAATGLRTEADYDVMPTLGLTYFLTDNVAVEAIAGTTHHAVRAKGGATNIKVKETWVLPPVVALQYHFAPKGRISPYVGAGVNYMIFYGGDNKNGFAFKVKDGFGTALQAGVDVAANDKWQLNFDVKKIFFDTTATDRAKGLKSKISLDPWVFSAGAGYRF
ncbi:MAG: outer membrane beta-barrel protein [Phenylobacterium sp.]|uniref:OmpW/AlkL family protein n=1 Tax=Phenylobacterium sp. TaxID=1871053 RepID=UPI001A4E0615|nr:OmpW family outer membrane protein [Phenylobacterium sp.]MBL8770920.1 outer membrane beta-barrel protein [Phenylobacterium sp.]